jgi:hypothetical protein
LFAHLDKLDDVAPRSTGEALEYLLGGIDVHARPVVGVERAQAHEFLALPLKGQVLRNDLYNITCLLDAAYRTVIETN